MSCCLYFEAAREVNKESKDLSYKSHLLVSKTQVLSVVRFPVDASGSSHDVRSSVRNALQVDELSRTLSRTFSALSLRIAVLVVFIRPSVSQI